MVQVAFWAFPQDVNIIRVYSNMSDNQQTWHRAVDIIKNDGVSDVWHVG